MEIIQGDCLEVMRGFADKSFDCIITDPPFEQEAHTKQRRVSSKDGLTEAPLDFEAITEEQRNEVSKHFARLARKWVLVFCQIEASQKWVIAMQNAGLVYRRTCIWVKPDGMPQYSGDRPGMGYETIVAMHTPGKSIWNGGGKHGVFIFNKGDNGGKKNFHMTQKPRPLMEELIALFTNEGESVLDPFMGSGTTLLAAKKGNRFATGIELNSKYVQVARDRLSALSEPLF